MRDSDYVPREDAGERFEDDPTRPVLCTYRSEPTRDATPHVGIALPEDVQARAIYAAERAIKLGLELVRLGRTLQAAEEQAFERFEANVLRTGNP